MDFARRCGRPQAARAAAAFARDADIRPCLGSPPLYGHAQQRADAVRALYRTGVLLLLVSPRVAPHPLFLGDARGSPLAEPVDAFVRLSPRLDRQTDRLGDLLHAARLARRTSRNRARDAELQSALPVLAA